MATSALRDLSLFEQKYFKQKHRCFRSILKSPMVSFVPIKVTWLHAAEVLSLQHPAPPASLQPSLGLLSVPGAGETLEINAVMPPLSAGLMNIFIHLFNEHKNSLLFQLNSARN